MSRPYYDPDNYDARTSLGHLLRRGRNLISAGIAPLFEKNQQIKDITFVQYVVLMCLRDHIATTSAELCQYICYDTGAFTRLLDQMEGRGWIKRKRSTEDRRVVELALTSAGRKAVASLLPIVANFYNELLSGFTHEEADTLIKLLTRLIDRLSSPKEERS